LKIRPRERGLSLKICTDATEISGFARFFFTQAACALSNRFFLAGIRAAGTAFR
jgi:hypothetical protein